MLSRIATGSSTCTLLCVSLLSCQQDKPPSQDQDAVVAKLLDRVSEGNTEGLKRAFFEWEVRSKKGKLLESHKAFLSYPDKFRLDTQLADGTKLRGYIKQGKLLVGPLRGPFLPPDTRAQDELEACFVLMGSLLYWDLLDESAVGRITDAVLTSTTAWRPKTKRKKLVRHLDAKGCVLALEIDGEKHQFGIAEKGPARVNPDLLELPSGAKRLEFKKRMLNGTWLDVFEPPKGDGTLFVRGQERRPKKPVLEKIEASQEISVPDPKTWAKRRKLLFAIGNELYQLQQAPAGAAVFTSEGKMLIHFRPDPNIPDARPQVPKGRNATRREQRISAVVWTKATWAEAPGKLQKELRSYLERYGWKAKGPLWLSPLIDWQRSLPTKKKRLWVRGEIRIQ